MDDLLRGAEGLPTHVVQDPFFASDTTTAPSLSLSSNVREHSSRMFSPKGSGGGGGGDMLDENKVIKRYTWASIIDDSALTEKISEVYSMQCERTGKCLFEWKQRDILGDWFCPSIYHTTDLFSGGKVEQDKRATAKLIVDQVLSFAEQRSTKDYEEMEEWAGDFVDRKLLSDLYTELDIKFSREKNIYIRHKSIIQTKPSHVTLYTNEKPPPSPSPPQSQSKVSFQTKDKSLDQDFQETATKHRRPKSSSREVQDFRTIDDDIRKVRTNLAKMDLLSQSADDIDANRYYHSLSMTLFSKCIITFFFISFPFSVVCQDAWAIIISAFYALPMGVFGFILSKFAPGYKGLDVYTIFSWLASFLYFIYVVLRTLVYTGDHCSVDSADILTLWLVFLFGAMISVFATTLTGIRKKVKDWEAQRRLPSQKNVGKQS